MELDFWSILLWKYKDDIDTEWNFILASPSSSLLVNAF